MAMRNPVVAVARAGSAASTRALRTPQRVVEVGAAAHGAPAVLVGVVSDPFPDVAGELLGAARRYAVGVRADRHGPAEPGLGARAAVGVEGCRPTATGGRRRRAPRPPTPRRWAAARPPRRRTRARRRSVTSVTGWSASCGSPRRTASAGPTARSVSATNALSWALTTESVRAARRAARPRAPPPARRGRSARGGPRRRRAAPGACGPAGDAAAPGLAPRAWAPRRAPRRRPRGSRRSRPRGEDRSSRPRLGRGPPDPSPAGDGRASRHVRPRPSAPGRGDAEDVRLRTGRGGFCAPVPSRTAHVRRARGAYRPESSGKIDGQGVPSHGGIHPQGDRGGRPRRRARARHVRCRAGGVVRHGRARRRSL